MTCATRSCLAQETLILAGGIVDEPLVLSGKADSQTDALRVTQGLNEIEADVELQGELVRIRVDANSELIFQNPIHGNVYLVLNPSAENSLITFTSQIDNGNGIVDQENVGTVTLGSSDNILGEYRIRQGLLRTDVARAFEPSIILRLGGDNEFNANADAVFDLNGCDQTVARIFETPKLMNRTSITSSDPAELAVVGEDEDSSLGGPISGAISLLKKGGATLTLAGIHPYTGETTVEGGVLLLSDADLSQTPKCRVMANGKLGGTGNIGGDVIIVGTHAPTEQTFLKTLTYESGSTLIFKPNSNQIAGKATPEQTAVSAAKIHFAPNTKIALSFSEISWSDPFWDVSQTLGVCRAKEGMPSCTNLKLDQAAWADSEGEVLKRKRPRARFEIQQNGENLVLQYKPS